MNRVLDDFYGTPWAIEPGKYLAIQEVLDRWSAGGAMPEGFQAAAPRAAAIAAGGVAVLPIYGVLSKRANMLTDFSGGTSADLVGNELDRMLGDPSVKAIVLDVDSPGGNVQGIPELTAKVAAARGQKPIIAIANAMAASAAYWVAASASEIMITPSGEVGSIGIIASHVDESAAMEKAGLKRTLVTAGKYKGDGAFGTPLSSETLADFQARTDEYYGMFVRAVAKGRGVSVDDVRGGFGEGRMVGAKQAVEQKMADHIGTLADAIVLARRRATVGLDRERRVALLERTI